MVLNKSRLSLDRHKEEVVYDEGGELLEEFTQRNGRHPITESVQGHIGQGFEQPA